MLKLHSMKPAKGAKNYSRRVGRGPGSGRGKTAGRGTKGQKARTGGRKGLKLKGLKFITARLPKLRGFSSPHAKDRTVTLREVAKAFAKGGSIVTPSELVKRGLVKGGRGSAVKILGGAELKTKLTVKGCKLSAGAKAAIEKAGGTVA